MALKSRIRVKTLPCNKFNETTDAERSKIRILNDFKKRFDSPHVKSSTSMGNNGPKAEQYERIQESKVGKLPLSKATLFPPPAKDHTSSSESEVLEMDGTTKRFTKEKVHRRKTKSERNKTKTITACKSKSTNMKKNEDNVSTSKERSIFKKSVKTVDKSKTSNQRTEKPIDKSAITDNRLTVGFGLFNRKKKSGTVSKDTNYVNSDLEIEVMPPEKASEVMFDISNIYGNLKRSKGTSNLLTDQETSQRRNIERTPESARSVVSTKSVNSEIARMEVDDRMSSLSESFPSSPDLETITAYVITQDDLSEFFPDSNLIAEAKTDLHRVHKMKNPNSDNIGRAFRTPLPSKVSFSRGMSSEVVKRECSDHCPPKNFSKGSNSTSTTQLSVITHMKGVEAMHLQVQRQTGQEHANETRAREIHQEPSRNHLSNERLNRSLTFSPDNLGHDVWSNEQIPNQTMSSPHMERSLKALTNAKTLLECNENAANEENSRMDIRPRKETNHAAPMDFLDSLSYQDYRKEPTRMSHYTNNAPNTGMDIEMFASGREQQNTTRPVSFDQLYGHKKFTSLPAGTNRKVVTQFLPENYNMASRFASHDSWIDRDRAPTMTTRRSPRNTDFLDYLESESQTQEGLNTSRLGNTTLESSPVWKPWVNVDDHSPSPPPFYPHKMF